ncbi:MAG TPA: DUF1146 domain-containing protein [Mollicutes bacterium]|jgi:uncharacterized integral membrane protein (TIGR02327 family)|nr:DUF1146 domain-containing protein [Mollicutes bacterium]
MNIKSLLYIFVTPLVIWALDGVNINAIFKKNKIYQASILYIMICLSLSYLVVNFFMDFFNYTKII